MRMRLEGGTVRAGCAALLLGVTVLTAVPPTRAGERVDLAAAAVHRSPVAPAVAGAPAAAPGRDAVTVTVDHAKIVRLPERTQTVVVGNPMIADITVQKHGILVVTGKAYGVTNLIALDGAGAMLAESLISVQAASESVVTVQRGLERESYSCTPNCQPSLPPGDAKKFSPELKGQAGQRNSLAPQWGGAARCPRPAIEAASGVGPS